MLRQGAPLQLIEQAFNNDHTFVYGDTELTRYLPTQFGVRTATFTSYQAIQRAFASGILPGSYQAVIYDNERWAATPVVEQRNPAHYEALVGSLLHRNGLLYIAAPAPDLMWTLGQPTDSYAAFLSARMPAMAARYADILDLQAQVRETDVPDFRAFVKTAVAQARAANPRIQVVTGIRTDPGSLPLLSAYQATATLSDGYWLNVNGDPTPAVFLLRKVYPTVFRG